MRASTLAVILVMMLAACAQPADEAGQASSEGAATAASEQTMAAAPAQTADAVQMPDKVREAVELAKAIEANPEEASRILQEHQMSQEDLEALMYEIAQDPVLSSAYDEAMSR